jgi:hypothetical protein
MISFGKMSGGSNQKVGKETRLSHERWMNVCQVRYRQKFDSPFRYGRPKRTNVFRKHHNNRMSATAQTKTQNLTGGCEMWVADGRRIESAVGDKKWEM